MDIFTPLVAKTDLHPSFQRLLDKHAEADREVLLQWAEGLLPNNAFLEVYDHQRRLGSVNECVFHNRHMATFG
jgi:hypothetical protein